MRACRRSAVAILSVLLSSPAFAHSEDRPKIAQLGWLTGRWETVRPARAGGTPVKIQEEWRPARDAMMMSLGTTTKGDSIIDSELVVIREDGKYLRYEAHPRGQESAIFHSIEVSDTSAVFENPSHDFPRRVGYRRFGADSLLAWIEGTQKGQPKRIEFPYHRVK